LKEALLYDALAKKAVKCRLCSRYCRIAEGKRGFCLVRENRGGKLVSLSYGKCTGLEIDPIEKKPFFHLKPGSKVLSFGTPGCNFRCKGCLNWSLSQAPCISLQAFDLPPTLPKDIARTAVAEGCSGVAYTYSEPTVFFEYARDIILTTRKIAPEKFHAFVSNGYFSRECFELIKREHLLDAIRIDLKFIRDDAYAEYTGGARLKQVQESIKRVYQSGIHLEVINLVIPGLNDSEDDVRALSSWVAGVGKDIPLHFIRFFPMHDAQGIKATPLNMLSNARKIAEEEGIEFAYAGNTLVDGVEDTACPDCGLVLVKRRGMAVLESVFAEASADEKKDPCCPQCGRTLNFVL